MVVNCIPNWQGTQAQGKIEPIETVHAEEVATPVEQCSVTQQVVEKVQNFDVKQEPLETEMSDFYTKLSEKTNDMASNEKTIRLIEEPLDEEPTDTDRQTLVSSKFQAMQ